MRFPPCECPRCREDEPRADGADREDGDGNESVLLRQLRARVAEENALRRSMRRRPE
ncbi:hypothetical protein AB0J21_26650 [Streptomyces sp. NPDC049954]|uniref:hypothetical protein n=1 Tax=Streptomyces sp. NPDC049954 TaxID=3155779 RepID=UPI003420CC54